MPEERKAKGGVAILLYKDLARRVQRIDRFKDRIIAVTLKNLTLDLSPSRAQSGTSGDTASPLVSIY